MTKLQERQKGAKRSLCLFWWGLIVLPGFSPSLKRHWSRCLRLFKRPRWKGCAPLSLGAGATQDPEGHPEWLSTRMLPIALLGEGRCSLPGVSSCRDFSPSQVQLGWGCASGNHHGRKHTAGPRVDGGWTGVWGGSHASQTSPVPWGRLALDGDALGGNRPKGVKVGRGWAGPCWQKLSWRGWICHLTQPPSS